MNQTKANSLINENSPYLLAHAHNPVNWYPWGDEALQRAKDENKLIFLSIGYHACHWCHVMETESFEDLEVAAVLNANYICIKVDREERKDLDAIYMKACQAMTGSGGWPLNVWLTPDKLPVYAGTYFPKRTYMNRVGLIETASHLSKLYRETPQIVRNQSFDILKNIKQSGSKRLTQLSPTLLEDVERDFIEDFDPIYGGFSNAPKFPAPHQLLYLLESKEDLLVKMGLKTIEQMIKGGIYDHLGGGFSRYSVDEKWMIPHFEKMLYDNSLLLDVLCKAWQVSHNECFKTVAMEVKAFMKNELSHDQGGFYSAYDADSEGVEGKFYRFKKEEIIQVLGKDDGEKFCRLYGVTGKGNFEGFTILNLIQGELDTINSGEIRNLRNKLFQYRSQRIKPALDNKILSLCNGFAIHGLASIAEVFDDQEALEMAVKADAYTQNRMMNRGTLLVSVCQDKGSIPGTVDDYGAIIRGLLKLFTVTQKEETLQRALSMLDTAIEKFWDTENGGFFTGEQDNGELIFNPKELYDGAIPSGNSLMAGNLLNAFLLSEEFSYKEYLDKTIAFFSADLNRYGIHASYFMSVLRRLQLGSMEARIVVKDLESKEVILQNASYKRLAASPVYDIRIIQVDPEKCLDGLPAVYICENGACRLPLLLDEIVE